MVYEELFAREPMSRDSHMELARPLRQTVKRGEKGIFILAPMVGYHSSRQNEIATEIDTDNSANERKPEQQVVGFRTVYVFDTRLTFAQYISNLALADDRELTDHLGTSPGSIPPRPGPPT